MSFQTYFRLASYATIAAAALALFVAGGVNGWLLATFALVMIVAWKLEGTRWQLTDRMALAVILISLPVFYFDWKFLTPYFEIRYLEKVGRGTTEISVLSHLILFLSGIKLLQRKADRDWFFLYLISFFEVLLASGLTASPSFLATLILYLIGALSTVVAFEIQKARRKVRPAQTRLLVPPDSSIFQKLPMKLWRRRYLETRRLPLVSIVLLLLILVLALPFFLIAPRTASSALRPGGGGLSGFIGFSDSVTLGQIGELKTNDEIFMHVRIEGGSAIPETQLRWRGVALDEFTGKGWKKSAIAERAEKIESDNGFFKLGTTRDVNRLTIQTFFVEPVDTPALFGAPRVVAVQAKLPFVRLDSEGAIQTRPHDEERLIYKVYSDTAQPDANALRSDRMRYVVESARYLELPSDLDPRIAQLAERVVRQAGVRNGYDAARAVESYLRDNYGYTLELRAGGDDPLADFLFNVKQGHCEYFATAMAVMLRTLGVATRVVNGFLPGEFNSAAGALTVRQSDAHSWVEVYFPETSAWVTFDPTPPAGRTSHQRAGLSGVLNKYSDALELMWFQYVIGYDKQEQRSVASSLRRQLIDLQRGSISALDRARYAFPFISKPIFLAGGSFAIALLLIIIGRRVRRFGWRRGLILWRSTTDAETSRVEFYQRLLQALEKQGIKRELYQTPIEFAARTGVNEARLITHAYNRVRFGDERLSPSEASRIEELISGIERQSKSN